MQRGTPRRHSVCPRVGARALLLAAYFIVGLITLGGGEIAPALFAAELAPPPPAPKPTLTQEEQQQGWILLFNGQSVDGWKGVNTPDFPYNGWTVENGYLRTIKPGPAGDIMTVGEYRDFELSFEWQIEPGGNSGVKYLVKEGRPEPNIPVITKQQIPKLVLYAIGIAVAVYLLFWRRAVSRFLVVRVLAVAVILTCGYTLIKGARAYFDQLNALRHSAVGLEYQVLDDFENPEPRTNPKSSAASLYILLEATGKDLYHDDRFNQGRVIVQADHVEHWLNGKKVLEYNLSDPALAQAVAETKYSLVPEFLSRDGGHIALQHHNNLVWYKNIKLRPLTAGSK